MRRSSPDQNVNPTLRPTVTLNKEGALVLTRDGSTRLERREHGSALVGFGGMGLAFLVGPAFLPPPVPVLLWVMTGTVAIIALGLVVVELVAGDRGADRGSWRIDATGVEFRSLAGSAHRLAWADVERVAWTERVVELVGNSNRVAFSYRFLTPDDWQALRDRIEAELSPHFDLTMHRPPQGVHLGRILLIVLPIGLLAAWFRWRLSSLTPDQVGWSVVVMLAGLVLPLILASFRARAIHRLNPPWRLPRDLDQTK